jgi:hypothetical protein
MRVALRLIVIPLILAQVSLSQLTCMTTTAQIVGPAAALTIFLLQTPPPGTLWLKALTQSISRTAVRKFLQAVLPSVSQVSCRLTTILEASRPGLTKYI